jgi:hypothetical protein
MKKYTKRDGGIGGNKTINEVKECILQDMRYFLFENKTAIAELSFKINRHSKIGDGMLDDFLFDNMYNKHFPVAYDDLIEWTKQEPMLLNKIIYPTRLSENFGILRILEENVLNYLKAWFYTKLDMLVDELK